MVEKRRFFTENRSMDYKSAMKLALIAEAPELGTELVSQLEGDAQQIGQALINPALVKDPAILQAAEDIKSWAEADRRRASSNRPSVKS